MLPIPNLTMCTGPRSATPTFDDRIGAGSSKYYEPEDGYELFMAFVDGNNSTREKIKYIQSPEL